MLAVISLRKPSVPARLLCIANATLRRNAGEIDYCQEPADRLRRRRRFPQRPPLRSKARLPLIRMRFPTHSVAHPNFREPCSPTLLPPAWLSRSFHVKSRPAISRVPSAPKRSGEILLYGPVRGDLVKWRLAFDRDGIAVVVFQFQRQSTGEARCRDAGYYGKLVENVSLHLGYLRRILDLRFGDKESDRLNVFGVSESRVLPRARR